jgi:hypothetical protein
MIADFLRYHPSRPLHWRYQRIVEVVRHGKWPDPQNDDDQIQVFNLMVRYYLDLKAVTNAEREIDREIERIDRIEEKAIGDALASQPVINLVAPADVKVIEDLIAQ